MHNTTYFHAFKHSHSATRIRVSCVRTLSVIYLFLAKKQMLKTKKAFIYSHTRERAHAWIVVHTLFCVLKGRKSLADSGRTRRISSFWTRTHYHTSRMLTYADECWRVLEYADACWRMQGRFWAWVAALRLTNAYVCWNMLTHADVCWRMQGRFWAWVAALRLQATHTLLRMLTYAGICWRMLTYAGPILSVGGGSQAAGNAHTTSDSATKVCTHTHTPKHTHTHTHTHTHMCVYI
jgi:hypothetical protein